MSTLYEYYNTGEDSYGYVGAYSGALWRGQTFTPQVSHKITSVKLKLYRYGSPGTITVGIRATDGSGHPTGEDLCSGTTNGNTLPTTYGTAEWREITFASGYDLSASTKYAIVVRAINGGDYNHVRWLHDSTDATYSGGAQEYSENSGSSWETDAGIDLMFEEWGIATIWLLKENDNVLLKYSDNVLLIV